MHRNLKHSPVVFLEVQKNVCIQFQGVEYMYALALKMVAPALGICCLWLSFCASWTFQAQAKKTGCMAQVNEA